MEVLISNSEGLVHLSDNQKQTPLHKACFAGQLGATKLLIESKSDVTATDKVSY